MMTEDQALIFFNENKDMMASLATGISKLIDEISENDERGISPIALAFSIKAAVEKFEYEYEADGFTRLLVEYLTSGISIYDPKD